jgi:hypothetical protein
MTYTPEQLEEMRIELFGYKVSILEGDGCMIDTASVIAREEIDAKDDGQIIELYEAVIKPKIFPEIGNQMDNITDQVNAAFINLLKNSNKITLDI